LVSEAVGDAFATVMVMSPWMWLCVRSVLDGNALQRLRRT
jgi:hypothetical protein